MANPRLRLYHKTMILQHFVIMGAIIFLCIGSYFIGKRVIATLDTVNAAASDVHDTFVVINRPRTGTLAGINEAIFGTSALIKHGNKILDHEEKQLSTLDTQEQQLFSDLRKIADNLNGGVTDIRTATNSLNKDLQTANKSLESFPQLVDNAAELTDSLNAKINDPETTKLLKSLSGTTQNVEGITGSLNKMTSTLEQKVDNPKHGFLGKAQAIWTFAWQVATLVK